MDRHFAQTQDCVCRKFALTEHTPGIGRDHPERHSDAPPRFGRTPYRTQAPTTAEKHTVTYTRRPIIRYTLKRVFFWPSPGGPIREHVRSDRRGMPVLEKRHVNPGTGTFRSTGTCKKYWRTIDSGTASNRKVMKNMTYRVLDPGFTFYLHEMHRVAFQHSATSTCEKYRCTIDFGTASNRKIMKNMSERRARAFATFTYRASVLRMGMAVLCLCS